MKLSIAAAACAAWFLAFPAHAAGLGEPEIDVAQRLLEVSLREDVPANHPRLAKTREQLALVAKQSGEDEGSVAQACMRNSRYAFDAARIDVRPLEVLEAAARFAPAGKPLGETTQRYIQLRVKKLDHAAALAQMAAGK